MPSATPALPALKQSTFSLGIACLAVGLLHAQAPGDYAGQLRRGAASYDTGEYPEAIAAFEAASESPDPALALDARKGIVRTAVRAGEFTLARRMAETLSREAGDDAEAMALVGDAMWTGGFFDAADEAYARALEIDPASPRARFGVARSLGSRSRLGEALEETERAIISGAPRDPDPHGLRATLLERLNRFQEAAAAFSTYADLLPPRERAGIRTARDRASFLRSFARVTPLEVSSNDAERIHTMPFKLVNNKIVVPGRLNGVRVEWVLDTGAERTGISPDLAESARVRAVSTTLTAGVGRPGVRRIRLGRADRVEVGSLSIRHVPVSIRAPALGGPPRWQGQSLSPIALGFSVDVDYAGRRVSLARTLPAEAGNAVTLPMRVQRLPMIRGTLNSMHPAYFVVDTGGEVISIGAETASRLGLEPARHIPLRVLGMSGQDQEAFLLPGVSLEFESLRLQRVGLAVLNLRAPSVLLGFQVGGIVGHKFLSRYRVAIDVLRSEVRLAAAS